ncbi:hypothetical protein BKA69DRAFT_1084322 [Paraphysoderma sedebokerense]|nr:hypothetical protein BKA69DRAFT_1084322 [Paraphysoderma sedebokerense]
MPFSGQAVHPSDTSDTLLGRVYNLFHRIFLKRANDPTCCTDQFSKSTPTQRSVKSEEDLNFDWNKFEYPSNSQADNMRVHADPIVQHQPNAVPGFQDNFQADEYIHIHRHQQVYRPTGEYEGIDEGADVLPEHRFHPIQDAKEAIGNLAHKTSEKAKQFKDGVQQVAHDVKESIVHAGEKVREGVLGTKERIVDMPAAKVKESAEKVKHAGEEFVHGVEEKYEDMKGRYRHAKNQAEETYEQTKENMSAGYGKVKQVTEEGVKASEGLADRVKHAAENVLHALPLPRWSKTKQKAEEMAGKVKETGEYAGEKASEAAEKVKEEVRRGYEEAKGFVQDRTGGYHYPYGERLPPQYPRVAHPGYQGRATLGSSYYPGLSASQYGVATPTVSTFWAAIFLVYMLMLARRIFELRAKTGVRVGDGSIELSRLLGRPEEGERAEVEPSRGSGKTLLFTKSNTSSI